MKIKFQGELSMTQLSQAVYEQLHQIEDQYRVRHAKEITLYLTPTNGFNNEIYCRDVYGKEVKVVFCHGPYRSAAEDYEI